MHPAIKRPLLAALASALAVVSCSDTLERQAEVRLASFNTGLAPNDVDYATERVEPVVAALADLDVDVLCVQELWVTDDWATLAAAAATAFPNTVHRPAEPVEVLCAPEEFDPLESCVEANCEAGVAGGDLANCALAMCDPELSSVAAGCADCLLEGVGLGADIAQLRSDCRGETGAGEVEAFLYGGAYDTGILSALPILEQESFALDSYLLRSAVDYARVDTDIGDLHVFCAHLASNIPQFEYRGDYESWEGEQARQVEQLIDFIADKSGGTGTVVVLGDLNTGPAIADLGFADRWGAHYQSLIDSGLTEPYLEQDDVVCTSCPDNSFHDPGGSSSLIDHVLLQRFEGEARVERILDEPITIEVEGQAVETHLSDHFGLQVVLEDEVD